LTGPWGVSYEFMGGGRSKKKTVRRRVVIRDMPIPAISSRNNHNTEEKKGKGGRLIRLYGGPGGEDRILRRGGAPPSKGL